MVKGGKKRQRRLSGEHKVSSSSNSNGAATNRRRRDGGLGPVPLFVHLSDGMSHDEQLHAVNTNLKTNRDLLVWIVRELDMKMAPSQQDAKTELRDAVNTMLRKAFESADALEEFFTSSKATKRNRVWRSLNAKLKIPGSEQTMRKYLLEYIHNRCSRLAPWLIAFIRRIPRTFLFQFRIIHLDLLCNFRM